MDDIYSLRERISKGFPSSHIVREYLESGEDKKIEAAELYLIQREADHGLGPEDEANLAYLLDNVEEPREELQEIGEKYLGDQEF